MNPRLFAVGLFSAMLAAGSPAQTIQLLSQTTILGVQARIVDSFNVVVDQREAQLQDNTVGTLQIATNVAASHLGLAQAVAASNSFVFATGPAQTTLNGSGSLRMEFLGSEEFWPTYAEMRTFAVADFSVRFELSQPATIEFSMAAGSLPEFTYNAYFDLKRNGLQIFNTIQESSSPESAPQFSGRLEPGIYDISFALAANPYGSIGPDFSNLLNGQCSVNWSLTIRPAPVMERRPRLGIQRDTVNDRIKLQMTRLDPGRFYVIRRSDSLVGGLWPVVGNFSAASDQAVWTDLVNPSVPSVFFQLESTQ